MSVISVAVVVLAVSLVWVMELRVWLVKVTSVAVVVVAVALVSVIELWV